MSSLAGDTIDVNKTDVIFASSQKAFGLPPGLVITFISPEAMEKSRKDYQQHDHEYWRY